MTNPLENELAGVKDLKKMSSSSVEGASIISLEFEPEIVIEDALQQVRDRVNRAKAKLPPMPRNLPCAKSHSAMSPL